jgi:2',3'-cyclic-nucleotide 2'-phosphodiesterase (5'-nucleotidase family)
LGGLSKKAYQIKNFRSHQDQPLLVVDSGNLLFKNLMLPRRDSTDKITANGIINAYEKMGYDAVAVGSFDLVAGIDFLKQQSSKNFPWISANLLNEDGSVVLAPYIIKKIGQYTVGIIGLTHNAEFLPSSLHIADWHTVLPALLKKLSTECDHIILLSNLPQKENYEIAKNHSDINIIISADSQDGNLNPVLSNNTLISQTSSQGKHIGTLSVEWGNNGRWEADLDKEIALFNSRLDAINREITRLEKQKGSISNAAGQLESLRNSKQDAEQQIESLKNKIRENTIQGGKTSTFTSRFIALKASLPNDRDIEKILSVMKQQIDVANKNLQ